jgi:hypothetical protein
MDDYQVIVILIETIEFLVLCHRFHSFFPYEL